MARKLVFNTKAYTIKHIKEKVKTNELVNRILESESAGYTNIAEGLKYGGLELEKIKKKHKFGVIINHSHFLFRDILPIRHKTIQF